jgi:hypothetical protein
VVDTPAIAIEAPGSGSDRSRPGGTLAAESASSAAALAREPAAWQPAVRSKAPLPWAYFWLAALVSALLTFLALMVVRRIG